MVERMFRLLVTLGSGLLMQACCSILPPPPTANVGLMLQPQETNNWCWAATTQMITTHLGHGVTQCDLANQRFGRNDCCTAGCPKNAACNMPGWTMFTEAGFTTQVTSTPLPWSRVTRELACSKRPMSYAYGPQSGGVGHVVVVSGYRDLGAIKYLAISDPWAPCQGTFRFLSFDEYSNSGTTNHWATNYEIQFGP
jgi:hypothetical protein